MNEKTLITDKNEAAERCVTWLAHRVLSEGSGAAHVTSDKDPRGRYWLGRLAPEAEIVNSDLGKRMERLEPCAVGLRILLDPSVGIQTAKISCSFHVWSEVREDNRWIKSDLHESAWELQIDPTQYDEYENNSAFSSALNGYDAGLRASIHVEVSPHNSGFTEVVFQLVNKSDPDHTNTKFACKGRLFEAKLKVVGLKTKDYLLDALPDSFRYNRRVPAYGLYCGVGVLESGGFETADLPEFDKPRPKFWNVESPEPDLTFQSLSKEPIGPCSELASAHRIWGDHAWDINNVRGEDEWSQQMLDHFEAERESYLTEHQRIAAGINLLQTDEMLARAFRLMNEAMQISATDAYGVAKYSSWRPFQIGFLLANLASCRGDESEIVDIVWFPTGGGKTETYLGLILTAAFFDRMRGKTTGITAWSRFPLRLLSLQQTQRFANALAAAEIVRKRHNIEGDPFGLGFLIGGTSTPNEIKDTQSREHRGQWDYEDDDMPNSLQMLETCPFCKQESIAMKFRRKFWRIEHLCTNESCTWGTQEPLPIWVVDTEVWRYLPTVVVGTLDKAAGISFQTNMRGMVAAPQGYCTEPGHGHTYAAKSGRPFGCLHPKCQKPTGPLPMDASMYGVTYRLQDELHLLRDSLGAVDAHYEAIFDHFQETLSGTKPKILASSATLAGYERQSEVLYRRPARVFPQPEPKPNQGFWAGADDKSMRRFLAIAPRGQTIEFAIDRMIVSMQTAIRDLITNPNEVVSSFGVDPSLSDFLISLYGTNVVYGNTLRDLDAVERSAETQWGDVPDPTINVETLTGRTQFGDVSRVLKMLENPQANFADRIHVIAASSMMSHGVDVDRLNTMVMLGLPLTTAEFIQATARVGRRWPSLVFVVHKIGRERDASVYRLFPQYVAQGDRFVEPIPITGKSRRVLEKTLPGVAFARMLMIHHQQAGKGLWKANQVREYLQSVPDFKHDEIQIVCDILGFDSSDTVSLAEDVANWYERFVDNVTDPGNGSEWASSLGPRGGPMTSLRDVEEQVPVWGPDAI